MEIIMKIIAYALILTAVGLFTWQITKQYYDRLIKESDRDWVKKLNEIKDGYYSTIVSKDCAIATRNQEIDEKNKQLETIPSLTNDKRILEDKVRIALDQNNTYRQIIANLKKDHEKELNEARDFYDQGYSELKLSCETKTTEMANHIDRLKHELNEAKSEEGEMAKKIQEQAMEIADLEKQLKLANDIPNGKLEVMFKDGTKVPYGAVISDEEIRSATEFIQGHAEEAKATLNEKVRGCISESVALECSLPTEYVGRVMNPEETEVCDSFIPLTPPDPITALTEAINSNYEKKLHERSCDI